MDKKVILVDMDDVIENLVEAWTAEIERKYGYHKTSEDITEWEMYKFYPDLEPNYIYDILDDSDFWKTVKPKEDAIKYLKLLQENFDVYIVTAARMSTVSSKISDILFKYFPFIDNEHVIVCYNKQMIKGDVIIDDGIHNLVGHEAIKILYDTPHNRNVVTSLDIHRMFTWKEIYYFIMKTFFDNTDRCVICGEYVPEGRMVCPRCEKKYMGETKVNNKPHSWYEEKKLEMCNLLFDPGRDLFKKRLSPCWKCPLRNYMCTDLKDKEKEIIDRWVSQNE